jgi:hypothetical protein
MMKTTDDLKRTRSLGERTVRPVQSANAKIAKFRHIDERTLMLRYVQPGLVGLIDGTLSTLAPIFAAALLSGSHAGRRSQHGLLRGSV